MLNKHKTLEEYDVLEKRAIFTQSVNRVKKFSRSFILFKSEYIVFFGTLSVFFGLIGSYIITAIVEPTGRLFPTISRTGRGAITYYYMSVCFIVGYVGIFIMSVFFYVTLRPLIIKNGQISFCNQRYLRKEENRILSFLFGWTKTRIAWEIFHFAGEIICGAVFGIYLPLVGLISIDVNEFYHQHFAWFFNIMAGIQMIYHTVWTTIFSLASSPQYLQKITSFNSLTLKYLFLVQYAVFAFIYSGYTRSCNDNGLYCNTRSLAQYLLVFAVGFHHMTMYIEFKAIRKYLYNEDRYVREGKRPVLFYATEGNVFNSLLPKI
eukprot:TRINITY_DN14231_c0_g1_i1.p1 TRINITY_DN14231_c0_g1~~TRINITY_DN14231_c0_g1_i1.p1  ORF type:complete len:320 (-),score=40.67 TRINITY_DN14231_c0_g1_i1:51-1010(-)